MTDTLGDRCKLWESIQTDEKIPEGWPILARLDGRAFHTLTRGMERPFDPEFSALMQETTRHLVKETNPVIAYTQSDEITLMWYLPTGSESQHLFGGKVQKLTSILAGMCSARFTSLYTNWTGNWEATPHFDCRVWGVPNLAAAADVFLWRELDARKNAITMAASAHYSHKELHGMHSGDKLGMLASKGVRFNDYPRHFRAGCYFRRVTVERLLTAAELEKIPEKHRPANGMATRTEVQEVDMPPLHRLKNREDALFTDCNGYGVDR